MATMLWLLFSVLTTVLSQFVPDNDDYEDDLSFLDVAIDRGENARLCDQLMRMTFLTNIILLGVVLILWGIYGQRVGEFYSRQKPTTPAPRQRKDPDILES